MSKCCAKCGVTKDVSEFNKRTKAKDGLNYYCKKCANKDRADWKRNNPEKCGNSHRKSLLRTRYGVTLKQYDKMFEKQNGVCAICGGVNKSGYRLAVDHDHDTGKIRGLLCQNCNRVVGEVENYPTLFRSIINYLNCSLSSK